MMKSFWEYLKNKKYFKFLLFFLFFISNIIYAEGVSLGAPSEWGDWFLIGLGEMLLKLGGVLLFISGIFFDNLINIGLSTELFNSAFIKVMWSDIRDLANLAFIIGAIIVAFSMMINWGNWRKSLIALIVVVFILNFSLYFSRVIVDMGNITARVFLTPISIKTDDESLRFTIAKKFYPDNKEIKFISVSGSFINSMQFESMLGEKGYGDFTTGLAESDDGGDFLIYALVLFVPMLAVAKTLFTGGFMFLGRMIWIIYYMVSAPFFFITAFLPQQENLWREKWLIPLLKKSFCIAVYVFFLWLSLKILNAGMMIDASNAVEKNIKFDNSQGSDVFGESSWIFLSLLIIKTIFVIKMLDMGNKLGNDWCEDGQSTLGSILGAVGKITTGAMKFIPMGSIARTAIGGIGKRFATSSLVKELASDKDSKVKRWAGDRLALFGDKMQQTKIGGKDYASDQKSRIAKLRELENRLPKEESRKRRLAEMGLFNKEGGVKTGRIKKVADEERQRELDVIKNTKLDDTKVKEADKKGKYKYEDVASSNLETTIEKMLESMAKRNGLEGDALINYVDSGMRDYQNGILDEEILDDARIYTEFAKSEQSVGEAQRSFEQKVKPADILLEDDDSLLGRINKFVPIPAASLESRSLRTEKDQEAVEAKVETQEKVKIKKREHQNIDKEAESKKSNVALTKNDLLERIEFGDGINAQKQLSKLEEIAERSGLSEHLQGVFASIKDDISTLVNIEKEEERIANLKMFEDEDYRAEDFNDDNMKGKLEELYAGDEKGLITAQEKIAFAQAGDNESFRELKKMLKSQYQKVSTNFESEKNKEIRPIKNKIKRNAENISRSLNSSIDSSAQFEKARVDEEVEVLIGKERSLAAKSETEADTLDKLKTSEFSGNQ